MPQHVAGIDSLLHTGLGPRTMCVLTVYHLCVYATVMLMSLVTCMRWGSLADRGCVGVFFVTQVVHQVGCCCCTKLLLCMLLCVVCFVVGMHCLRSGPHFVQSYHCGQMAAGFMHGWPAIQGALHCSYVESSWHYHQPHPSNCGNRDWLCGAVGGQKSSCDCCSSSVPTDAAVFGTVQWMQGGGM